MNAFKHSVPYTYLEFAHTSLPNYMQTLAEDEIIFSQKPLACSFPEVMVSGFLLELLGRSIPKPLSAELQVIWSSPLCFADEKKGLERIKPSILSITSQGLP